LQGGVELQARIQKIGLGDGQCDDRRLSPMRAVGPGVWGLPQDNVLNQ
jgi:hypothetical protein